MRITTSMVQRNVLADLNTLSAKLAKTQSKASSGKEITRPSDDPYNTSRAMGLRQNLDATEQYQSNISDAQGWQDATESALGSITDYVNRAQSLLLQGPATRPTPRARLGRRRDRPDHPGPQGDRERQLRRPLPDVGHRDLDARRTTSATTTPIRATRPAWTRPSRAWSARSARA